MGCATQRERLIAQNVSVRGKKKMKLKPELKKLITEVAKVYSMPPEIIYGIVCAESDGIPTAKRFEPAFLERYIPKDLREVHPEEAHGRATSWGLMQVMGSNLRNMQYMGPFSDLLHDQDKALNYGCRFFRMLYQKYFAKWGINGVIAAYNAGSPILKTDGKFRNQAYVNKVLKRSREY
jgi:soluble lytic murein transglycosylase-like protein